jgi:activator of HSP90 ATPase
MYHQGLIIFQNRKLHFTNKYIIAISFLLAGIFFMQSPLFSQVKPGAIEDSSNNILIHQEIDFKETPQRLYQTLLNSKEFSACTKKSFNDFSEMSANIDSSVGGIFSLFDGHIIGRILELVPNQRIVEAWRVVDWPAGAYSIAKSEFKQQGSGTHLVFDHVGFPRGLKEHLAIGWQQHYWDALHKYFQ